MQRGDYLRLPEKGIARTKKMKSKLVATSVLIASLFSENVLVNNDFAQEGSKVASLIRNLWSPDESLRKTSKHQLRQLGSIAIQPLLNLFGELKNDPKPHRSEEN